MEVEVGMEGPAVGATGEAWAAQGRGAAITNRAGALMWGVIVVHPSCKEKKAAPLPHRRGLRESPLLGRRDDAGRRLMQGGCQPGRRRGLEAGAEKILARTLSSTCHPLICHSIPGTGATEGARDDTR